MEKFCSSAPLCFHLSGPQFFWENVDFYCHLIQALGITHDAKHGPLPFSCAGERRGKNSLVGNVLH